MAIAAKILREEKCLRGDAAAARHLRRSRTPAASVQHPYQSHAPVGTVVGELARSPPPGPRRGRRLRRVCPPGSPHTASGHRLRGYASLPARPVHCAWVASAVGGLLLPGPSAAWGAVGVSVD